MLKASQLALDRGSMISKILEIEKNSNVQLEHINVKTKKDDDERQNSYGKNLVLECDHKEKGERVKCKMNVKMTRFVLEEIRV